MQAISRKGTLLFLTLILLIVTCSCQKKDVYRNGDYLQMLAEKMGLQCEDAPQALQDWGILKEIPDLHQELDYDFLTQTLYALEEMPQEGLPAAEEAGWIPKGKQPQDHPGETVAAAAVEKALEDYDSRQLPSFFDLILKEGVKELTGQKEGKEYRGKEKLKAGDLVYLPQEGFYQVKEEGEKTILEETDPLECIDSLSFSSSAPLDLSEAEITLYGEELPQAALPRPFAAVTRGKTYITEQNGYKITVSTTSSSVDVHFSKHTKNDLHLYGDLSLSGIRPQVIWKQEQGELQEAGLQLRFKTDERVGAETSRSKDLYLDLKDLSGEDFWSRVKGTVHTEREEVEETLRICRIRTPIPELPFVFLDLDLNLHLYAGGKAQLALSQSHELGFQMKNGVLRLVSDHDHSLEPLLRASAKSTVGVALSVESLHAQLMDVEAEAGVEGKLNTAFHFFDEDGKVHSQETAAVYDDLSAMAQENGQVKVCADLSLHWLAEMTFNTKKTLLSRFGFSQSYTLLDEDDQIFGRRHLENGHFVDHCTVSDRSGKAEERKEEDPEKISLSRYALILEEGTSCPLPLLSLPEGYKASDLLLQSEDLSVALTQGQEIRALAAGSTRIRIATSDGRHQVYLSVLVSHG
ncbi:MAG: hypothetical protein IKE21_05765 [Erysipelotrichaceae bacterium]|nr:hypothetical protein [Erysipelotrichaceae bacterium]